MPGKLMRSIAFRKPTHPVLEAEPAVRLICRRIIQQYQFPDALALLREAELFRYTFSSSVILATIAWARENESAQVPNPVMFAAQHHVSTRRVTERASETRKHSRDGYTGGDCP